MKQENQTVLENDLKKFNAIERQVIQRFIHHEFTSRNVHQEFEENQSFGGKLADKVASFGGSWPFVILFAIFLGTWITLNSVLLTRTGKPFDPYPYILLNLFLSTLAAIQAPIILMSQNRQADKDRSQSLHDYEVNLKAEAEILSLHEKLDELRQERWDKLIQMQQNQLDLLNEIRDELNPPGLLQSQATG